MKYSVQLINAREKDRLYEQYESRFLYTRKAGIYGCCIKLLTEVEYVKDRWNDNFYTMSEDIRSHGRLIVLEDTEQPMTVKYDPYIKTAFLIVKRAQISFFKTYKRAVFHPIRLGAFP